MHDSRAASSPTTAPAAASTTARANLASVATMRIIFGHQSVGANVLQGIRELSAQLSAPAPTIVSTRDVARVTAPAIDEFMIGENGDPASKQAAFASVLDAAGPDIEGVALFKYCFLDITPQTDVARLFAAHRDLVRALQARHPRLTFVHVTAPLTVAEPASKALIKRMLGKPSSRDANVKRNEFNALLRREFAGEPIFDLARVESTAPDGSRSFFTAGADTVYAMAPALTDDGGHLDAAGRRAAAEELLAVLASTASTAQRRLAAKP